MSDKLSQTAPPPLADARPSVLTRAASWSEQHPEWGLVAPTRREGQKESQPLPTAPALTAIVAMTQNRVIGKDGGMPWSLPADMHRFTRLSRGKPNIMGRKVWDSLHIQPLPERANIVLTRNPDFVAAGALVAHTPQEALALAQANLHGANEIAIIGGAEVYKLFGPELTRLELTIIQAELDGDTFFPELSDLGSGAWQLGAWQLVSERLRPADERNRYDLLFQTWER